MVRKSIKRNYFYNLIYQMLLLIAPLITTPYLSRVLGARGIGTISYAESVVSYFTLFGTLGITTYGQREISYVQGSLEKRSQVFWNTKVLEICTAGLALAAYLTYVPLQKNAAIFSVLVFNIIAVIADVTWFFQGMEEFGIIVSRNILFKIISIAYIFIFIKDETDVVKYAFGLSFFLFLGNCSLWRYLFRYIKKVNLKNLHPFSNIRTVISLFVPTIAIQIYTVLDKTMIGVITQDAFENGCYEQAIKISKMLLTAVAALGTVMIPRIGALFQSDEIERVKELMYRGYRFVWFLGIPLCFGLIMISDNFVPWFFGSGYDKVIPLINILAFLILSIGINNVTGMQYLIPTKRQNLFTLTVIIGSCINLILNLILIHQYQSVGAAVASVIAETVIAGVQLIIVRKELSFWRILKTGGNYYIAGLVMAGVLWIVRGCFFPSIIHTLILMFIGMSSYSMMLIFLKDSFFIGNLKIILQKISIKVLR